MSQERGKFIVFEGAGAAGKGTQIQYAKKLLEKNGYEIIPTREPGGTPAGEEIRQMIFDLRREELITSGEQMVLFFAARRLLIKEVIEPALAGGKIVLGDRFDTSTGAYQGYAEKGDMGKIHSLRRVALKGFKPDAIIFIDVSPQTAMDRAKREQNDDPFDRMKEDYFSRLVAGYREMAKSAWGGLNWYPIDGEQTIEKVSDSVAKVLEDILSSKLKR